MAHIGILLCDEHRPDAVAQFGTYDNNFKMMLNGHEQVEWQYTVWRCFEGVFPTSTDECDGWIISGSKWGVYDPDIWIKKLKGFIHALDEVKAKVVGVCFGHQIIHAALGGKVAKSEKGWGVGAYAINVYEPLGLIVSGQTLRVLAIHQDQVQKMAPDFTLVAGCAFTPFAITKKNKNILTFQSHPEFEEDFYQGLCENIRGKLGEEAMQTVRAGIGQSDDRDIVRQVIRFFLQ